MSKGANTPSYSPCGLANENKWLAYAIVVAINRIQSNGSVGYATYGAQWLCTYMVAEPRGDPYEVIQSVTMLKVSKSVITLDYSMEGMISKASGIVRCGTIHKVSQGATTPGYSPCGMA